MQTTAETLLSNMNILYQNIYNLLTAFHQASDSNYQNITVTLTNLDGSTSTVTVNSFSQILTELARIDNNFQTLTNSNNISYIINGDGSLSSYQKVSLLNTNYLNGFTFGTNGVTNPVDVICSVDNISLLKKMVFPNVTMPVTIASELFNDVICSMYEITQGWENISAEPTILELNYLLNNGDINFNLTETQLIPAKEQVKYFGKFAVLNINSVGNISTIVLDQLNYTGLNVNGNSIPLQVNDILVSSDGLVKYSITNISIPNKTITCTRISGTSNVTVGIDKLFFNQLINTNNNVVNVPIQANKNLVIFFKATTLKITGYPSIGIKIDTSTYSVDWNGTTYTIDEFFAKYVTDFGSYMISLIKETSIPLSLGVQPQKPILESSNFKVVQINKHITDTSTINDITTSTQSKEQILNSIETKQNQITQILNETATLKYKSIDEKNSKLKLIQQFRNDINTLQQTLLTVTRNIDNDATQAGLKNVKPKYKVLCYWDKQSAIFSPNTPPQNIVKYNVQYRYLSLNADTVSSTNYTMISNGQQVNVAFSTWNNAETSSLDRVINADGTLTWQIQNIDSVDSLNINQTSISINQGESIEIRVQAVSEAGYPISPLTSEWSDIMRVDFPTDLIQNGLSAIVAQNTADLQLAEFNDILIKSGYAKHIDDQVVQGDVTFKHQTTDIHSGFYTGNQQIIDLFTFLQTVRNDINILQNKDKIQQIIVSVIDFNNEPYIVQNNTTIQISGGNYNDNINLLDTTKYGSIIRKQGFIKISNKNNIPLEIKTLVPGTIFDNSIAPNYYNVPVKTPTNLIQNSKQVIYFRNIDLTGQQEDAFKLVKPKLTDTDTYPSLSYIDNLASEDLKNIVYLDNASTVQICKLLPNAGNDFVAFTTEHPMFNPLTMETIIPEFDRIKLYTENIKALNYQSEFLPSDTVGLGFNDNDLYCIGENSCGAFLYPIIANPTNISVIGDSTIATLILPPESDILIPFVYEYRMIDRIGKVNGKNDNTINDTIIYQKKLGIDLLLNNSPFKFDLLVTSQLKSSVPNIDSLNVNSILGAQSTEI